MILPAGRVTQRRGEADRGTEKVERVSKGGILRRFRLALTAVSRSRKEDSSFSDKFVLFTFVVDTEVLPHHHQGH